MTTTIVRASSKDCMDSVTAFNSAMEILETKIAGMKERAANHYSQIEIESVSHSVGESRASRHYANVTAVVRF